MLKLPKRLDIKEVRTILGDAAAERLLAAYLRRKAIHIIPVSIKQIDAVEEYLRHPETRKKGIVTTLGTLTHNRILQSAMARAQFMIYLKSLRKGAEHADQLPRSQKRKTKA